MYYISLKWGLHVLSASTKSKKYTENIVFFVLFRYSSYEPQAIFGSFSMYINII